MNYLYAYVRLVWKTLNGRFNKLKFYFTFLILFVREFRFCVSKPLKDEFFVQPRIHGNFFDTSPFKTKTVYHGQILFHSRPVAVDT